MLQPASRRLVLPLLAAALVSAPALAEGPEESFEPPAPGFYAKLVDLVLVRPVGLVPTLVAPVGCLLGLPVAWAMRSPVDARQVCLDDPLEFTFARPLGRL